MTDLLKEFRAKLYKQDKPAAPMLYVYGNAGMGKSSLAATFPAPFFLMTEQAFPNDSRLDGRSIYIKSYAELVESLRLIYGLLKEDDGSELAIKTLVLDNISGIEQLIRNAILAITGKKVEDFGFGQGYELLKDYWAKDKGGIFKAIKSINEEFGVAIILIDHCNISSVTLPGRDPFNRYVPAATGKITNYLTKLMDEVMFIDVIYNEQIDDAGFGKKNVKVSTSSQGLLIRSGNGQAEYISKSRYGLPTRIIYKENEGFKALEPYLPKWHTDKTEKAEDDNEKRNS